MGNASGEWVHHQDGEGRHFRELSIEPVLNEKSAMRRCTGRMLQEMPIIVGARSRKKLGAREKQEEDPPTGLPQVSEVCGSRAWTLGVLLMC